jgi:6-phosphofructokinase 1
VLASRLGVAAIDALLAGEKNIMIGEVKGVITHTPLKDIVKIHLVITPTMSELINVLSI